MRKIVQKPLGEVLIDAKVITLQQLNEALELQKKKGGLIGQVLVGLGYTSEESIAQALTTQYGFPFLPLSGYEIDVEIAKTIPEKTAYQNGMVVVDKVGMILTVAMSNPLNVKALEEVEAETGLKIQVYVCTATDLTEALARAYKATA